MLLASYEETNALYCHLRIIVNASTTSSYMDYCTFVIDSAEKTTVGAEVDIGSSSAISGFIGFISDFIVYLGAFNLWNSESLHNTACSCSVCTPDDD